MPNDEPLKAITDEPHEGGHEKHNPQRKIHQGQAGGPPKNLAQVRGRGQVIELDLRNPQHGLQHRRVGREIEVGTGECLNPNRRHQNHPFSRLARHEHENRLPINAAA